jgi:hypothetical protein
LPDHPPLLAVQGLSVTFDTDRGPATLLPEVPDDPQTHIQVGDACIKVRQIGVYVVVREAVSEQP